jgi:hypothetical protein
MKMLCLVVFSGLGASALAQEVATPSPAPQPQDRGVLEELVVPGRRPENLRVEIERLEVAVYQRFNALNTNDEYDIHCVERAPTGSNIPQRTCAPNFVIMAESRDAKKLLHDGRTGMGNMGSNSNRAQQRQLLEQKSRELTEEMQRIAREDEQFMRDLARLDELKRFQDSETERR